MHDAADFGKSAARSLTRLLLALPLCAVLSGCLGGGGDGSTAPATGALETPAPPAIRNKAPEISGVPPAVIDAGQDYSFVPAAIDSDNDFLEFSITNKPAWAQFSVETGALTGAPGDGDVGEGKDITITVTDGRDQRSVGPFRILVRARDETAPATNFAPDISGTPSVSVDVGAAYSFQPVATDADGDKLRFSISNRPSWVSFSTASGTFTGTPTAAHVGNFSNIVISVSDGRVTVSMPAFAISVKGPDNNAPAIAGTPMTSVQVAQAYSFQPTAIDADGDALNWSIQNKPSWATFSAATGRLSGTPAAVNVGNFSNIVISVSDGRDTVSLPAFAIAVQAAANNAPRITGTPTTSGTAGVAWSFQPTATDADGDALGYTIQNRPAWATFATATGRLSGTPTAAGTFAGIIISVSDGKTTASLAPFAIIVGAGSTPANSAPTISGAPATTVNIRSSYSFQPSARDPEGATMAFSIQRKPAWATFNTATGKLAGTPTAAGTFSDVVISVSDGVHRTSLPPFSITATSATLGSAVLSWVAPTQNTDGSALNDLAGYRIVYGSNASALDQTIEVSNPGLTSYVVERLAPGNWFFAVKAYSAAGGESSNSNVTSKTIP